MTLPRLAPADYLSGARLIAVPVLWGFAALRMPVVLGIGAAMAGLTDILDGPVARWSGRSSRYGSQLDSLADMLLAGSMFIWVAWFRTDFFMENAVPLLIWAGLGLAALAATLIRWGRFGDLHLYSAKAAGFLGHLFVIWLLVFDNYSPLFFTVAVTVAIAATLETLLVALTRERVEGRVGTILRPRREAGADQP